VTGLDAGYGQITVIHNGGVCVRAGEVVGLVGRNGAGKTTFISAIAGLVRSSSGSILVSGQEISSLPASKRVAAGVAICPSGGRLFKSLTVEENLTIGATEPVAPQLKTVFSLFPELHERRERYAGQLSGGERQMTAIGRALMLRPRLLLMDEPSEGLAPVVVLRVAKAIKELRETGVGILLAEQNMKFTDLVCQRWYSIEKGTIASLRHETSSIGQEGVQAA
jgi:branched-chain amino acid transport system ATP-binding protein